MMNRSSSVQTSVLLPTRAARCHPHSQQTCRISSILPNNSFMNGNECKFMGRALTLERKSISASRKVTAMAAKGTTLFSY